MSSSQKDKKQSDTQQHLNREPEHEHEHEHEHGHDHDHDDGSPRKMLWKIIITIVATLLLQLLPESVFPAGGWARFVLFFAVYLFIGWNVLHEAVEGILSGEVFDEDFLMAVATIGAFALALYKGNGDYNEAIAVMLFFQIGELFESYAVGKSRKNIADLMDIRPDYANVMRDGQIQRVKPDEVAVGTTIVVQPGEKIPIDGIVDSGTSTLNTAALTGESLPRDIKAGDEVLSGCINLTGVLNIRTTKAFGESTVSKILELMQNSSKLKSHSEAFITRFAHYYTPIVCFAALALAVLPPVVRMLFMDMDAAWGTWIYRALTFLVISCPCALVISIPLSFFAGIGGASRHGVLVKGSNYLEALTHLDTVVFDKTGTLTLGVFEVSAIHHPEYNEDTHECHCHDCENHSDEANRRLLEMTALAECSSSHPISKSLRKAYGRPIDHNRVSNIQEISGQGITATVDGHAVAAGNEKLMNTLGISFTHCLSAGTIIHVAIDQQYAGHIVLGDIIKPHAAQTIAELHHMGIRQTVMLTGDTHTVAEQVASGLGMDHVYSELLPADKVDKVEELLQQKPDTSKSLAFVGDGINDAPVLTRADVGIAMGGVGSDAAIEAADVVLMDDDPLKIVHAIRIANKCLRIVWQNIIFAIGIKVLCLILGAVGIADMWMAIFADVGVMILCVLNAIRAMHYRE